MTILLLFISFFLLFLTLSITSNYNPNFKTIAIKSILLFSTSIVCITELGSLFYQLNYRFFVTNWLVFSLLNLVFIFLKKEKLKHLKLILTERIRVFYTELSNYQKIIYLLVTVIFISIFIQGIVYPPNNWDSLTYHMARIPSWISHQSIEHFPTSIFRQLYQPPFSEIVIMHLNVLSGSDYFSNSVQFIYLFFSILLIVSILKLLGIPNKFKLIAIVLTITIPEIILQASSTQNDIVVSFFILSTIYFAIKSIKEINIKNQLYLGLSIGIGLLTKGTAYIFLAPILMIFAIGILSKIYITKDKKYLVYPILAILITISLNSGHYTRNYKLSNNILGIDKSESMMYSNQNMSPMLLVSNLIKNVGLHTGPYPINYLSDKVIFKLHSFMGVNINNPDTNIAGMHYTGSPDVPNHEDSASNPFHFILLLLSFIFISYNFLKTKKAGIITIYILMFILQVVLFSFYLKWQPWNTRLHVPLFLIAIPIIIYAANKSHIFLKTQQIIIPILIIYAFGLILFNKSRPILSNEYTSPIKLTDNRFKKYFTNRPELYNEYKFVLDNIYKINAKNIGLILGTDDWEYPLFTTSYIENINPIHLKVTNISKKIPIKINTIDCIVSTTTNSTFINYNGKQFKNMNEQNSLIWIYQ